MRILVVEDDRPLADVVVEGLRDAGMAVDVAYDGLDAAAKLNLYPYDVVVLDRDLPGLHGDALCTTHHRLAADQHGPDADRRRLPRRSGLRARAGCRRLPPQAVSLPRADPPNPRARAPQTRRRQRTLRAAGIELNPLTHTATRDGRALDLSNKEFAVLEALLEASPEILSAEQLLHKAWDENADPFTQTVKVTIGRLRRKLGEPPIIHTITGIGYRV